MLKQKRSLALTTTATAAVAAAAAAAFLLQHETEAFLVSSQRRASSLTNSKSRHELPAPRLMPPDGPAGSFFHPVPDSSDDDNNDNGSNDENNSFVHPESTNSQRPNASTDNDDNNNREADEDDDDGTAVPEFDDAVSKLLRQRRKPPRASRPSTINGIPTEKATGFGKPTSTSKQASSNKTNNKGGTNKPYVAIGPDGTAMPIQNPPINDPSKPEMDDQGYTLYTNEETGEKSRVFDALVDYPCKFTLKIVGANEGTFVEDMLMIVADACQVLPSDIEHSTKAMGKWTSVTVQAPVESSVMLYGLYEKVDLDPRVKFKF